MLNLVAGVARRVIENGGETYRAEELLLRAGRALGLASCHCFVTPTGVFASAGTGENARAIVRRVERRGIDLGEICRLEDLVQDLENGTTPPERFPERLADGPAPRPLGMTLGILSTAWIAAFFSLLFGGGANEFGFALAIGPIVAFFAVLLDRASVPVYFERMGSSALVVFLALGAVALRPETDLFSLTSGPLMLLVPGIAITNSVRDTIEGDLLAGVARGVEAFLLAAAMAVGAGFALKCWALFSRVGP